MKRRYDYLAVAAVGLSLTACYTPSGRPDQTASGALAGGAIGAGTGAIIGGASGNPATGAAIGGVLGLVTGGLIGNAMDQAQRERLQTQAPQTWERVDQGQPLGLADIKAMAKADISDEVMISQIRNSHTVYHLTTAEIIDLKEAGVHEKVIDVMINTPSSAVVVPAPPSAEAGAPPPPPAPVVESVVVAPGPGYIWIDGAWVWGGARWMWVGGHWAVPPYRHARWVRGGWVAYRGRWMWAGGHWR